MNFSVLQTGLVWEDVEANLRHLESMIATVDQTDLIILPEMFSTGFSMQPEKFARDSGKKSLEWMQRLSIEKQSAVCGSFMYEKDERYYNAFAFVAPGEETQWYYKRHLFTPGEESKHYSAGKERILINYKNWRICPLICYDLRFPVFSRNNVGYDLLIYVANWPEKRNYAWQQLLKARAIENQSYVIACNRIGEDPKGVNHIGNSCIINYLGEEIGFGSENKVFRFNLSRDSQDEFRKVFPVLDDADKFELL